jgi:hypothetical protein
MSSIPPENSTPQPRTVSDDPQLTAARIIYNYLCHEELIISGTDEYATESFLLLEHIIQGNASTIQ